MIEVKAIPNTNIVEMRIAGSITAAEFEKTLATFTSAIEQHGKIRVLEVIEKLDLSSIPWSVFWDDIRFSLSHMRDMDRVGVVADQDWIRGWVTAFTPLFKAEMKSFPLAQLPEARDWLGIEA